MLLIKLNLCIKYVPTSHEFYLYIVIFLLVKCSQQVMIFFVCVILEKQRTKTNLLKNKGSE